MVVIRLCPWRREEAPLLQHRRRRFARAPRRPLHRARGFLQPGGRRRRTAAARGHRPHRPLGEPGRATVADGGAPGRTGQEEGLRGLTRPWRRDDFPADAVEVGRVVGAWGIKGGSRSCPSPPTRRRCSPPSAGTCWRPTGRASAPPPLLRVTQSREQGGVVVASAQEVPDRNAAEALKGARVFVARASFPTAGADEYYWVDLIGCAVVNREGVALGDVGRSDRHRRAQRAATGAGRGRALIPFVAAYVDGVDLAARRITVDWGLDF